MKKLYKLIQVFIVLTLLLGTTPFNNINAQVFLPFQNDNFVGVSNVHFQPASIVDNRLKFDLEIIGVGFAFDNNWASLDKKVMYDWNTFSDSLFAKKYLHYNDNSSDKSASQSLQARAFNFMLPITQKDAVAFSFRVREILNVDNLSNEFANYLLYGTNAANGNGLALSLDKSTQSIMSWAEYGFTYARVLIDRDETFLKFGGTAKLLQGMGAGYAFEKELSYSVHSEDTISVQAEFGFGASATNLDEITKFQFVSKPSFGFDFGVEYEYRPNYKKYKYNMDGEYDLWRRDLNKYKWKIGASILDLGTMRFNKEFNSNDFLISEDTLVLSTVPTNQDSLISWITDNYSLPGGKDNFNMLLPTTLNLTFDYNVVSNFYVSAFARLALFSGKKTYTKVHYGSVFAITPRWETPNFGLSVPVRLNQFGRMNMGLGLRFYNIMIGSNTLISLVGLKKEFSEVDLFVAIKIPIKYKAPKDKDKDEVSDGKDECPNDKGLLKFSGCPDSDNDGIVNKKDLCPYTAGKPEFQGCPDTDNDGVEDKFDKCVDVYGLKIFAGCPDTDNDGVQDSEDSCIYMAGIKAFFGCPDTDEDSIPDYLDECPEVAGQIAQNGCPDTDGDGIRDAIDQCPQVAGLDSLQGCPYIDTDKDGLQDKYDRCPQMAGPIENLGCPFIDTDKDSVLDKDDLCPMTPGPVSNNGCPEIAVAEQEVLNTAFNNLEFETGKSIIKSSSFTSLDELAKLLAKKPDFKLLIEGHTDNVGNDNSNMSLSQNRALAVQKFLVDKGISTSRITSKWYGETKPIAPNDTELGRQKNRRVEMKVVFD